MNNNKSISEIKNSFKTKIITDPNDEWLRSPSALKHFKCELYENYNIKDFDKAKQEFIEDHKDIYNIENRALFEQVVNSITLEEMNNMLIINKR